jgi:integrase
MLRAIVIVLADTGCRRMEILRLRWDQTDLGAGIVTLGAENTKSGRPRKVPLSQRAVAAIKGVRPRPPSPYVFTRRSGKPHNPRHLYRLYQRAVAAAGLQGVNGEPITFHTLRHSFVSQARRRGIPERTVMAITCHATRSAFDRYGSRVDEDEIAGAVAKMEAARGPARPPRHRR